MGRDVERRPLRTVLALVFVVGALGYTVYAVRNQFKVPEGSSERDAILLVCMNSKCEKETIVTSAKYADLDRDSDRHLVRCPKCSEMSATIAMLRCPKCHRALPPQGPNAAYVCPFCKAALGPH